MNLKKPYILTIALLFLALFSCSKEDSIQDEANKFEIDLAIVSQNDSDMSKQIIALINSHRDSLGLAAIQMDTQYASAFAVDHSLYMIELGKINHNNFGHRSEAIKYYNEAISVGEIVSYGQVEAENFLNACLRSPSHKVIIEGNYTHTGFGVLKCSKGRNYFTMLFYKK